MVVVEATAVVAEATVAEAVTAVVVETADNAAGTKPGIQISKSGHFGDRFFVV